MKKIITLMLCLLSASMLKAQSDFVEKQVSVTVDRDRLIENGYEPTRKSTELSDKQPVTTKQEIERFLFKVNAENAGDPKFDPEISSWLTQNLTSYANDATIIFIRHPLKLANLFDQSAAEIAKKYVPACQNYNTAASNLELFSAQAADMQTKYSDNLDAIKLIPDSIKAIQEKIKIIQAKKKLTAADKKNLVALLKESAAQSKGLASRLKENETYITQLYRLRGLIDSYAKEKDAYFAQREALQKSYTQSKSYFVEDTTQIITTILSKENYEYTDYIFNKKNVMVVMLGNFKDYKLQFTNKEKRATGEAKDLALIFKSVTGLNATDLLLKDSGTDCAPKKADEATIQVTFVLMKRSKIEAPSNLEFKTPKGEVKTLSEIHERTYIGIKVGLSLTNVENKNFNLNATNGLTIKTDSLDSKNYKTNMMALLEIYPFGRDYDRLKVITDKDNSPFHERLGFVGGVKISKDPLETIFGGLSLAISKEFNVVAGIAFTKIAKDVTNLNVGYSKTIDYLRANVDKEYKPTFYMGFSLSPSQLFKSLGISK
jgi:hypothetical protein